MFNKVQEKSEVVILAGGFGTRLATKIGFETPKCMAIIDGLPLIETQLKLCADNGFKNIIILLHHLSDKVMRAIGFGDRFGLVIKYEVEEKPRGTAGAISDILSRLNETFLVIYGDTYLDVNLRKFFNAKKANQSVLTFCHPNSHPFDSDLLDLDESGKVLRVFRPSMLNIEYYKNIVNAALYVMDKNAFRNQIPISGKMDISSELFPQLINHGFHIQSYKSPEYIKDMGTPNRYHVVKQQIKAGIPSHFSDRVERRCIFLDRDGVINREVGHLTNINDFELLPGAAAAIKSLNDAGFLVICVTNQPVIARGEITENELSIIHMKMEALLGKEGAYLDAIYHCPHHPDAGFKGEVSSLKIQCQCRKPQPGMLSTAIKDFGIDVSKSWIIGDHSRDINAGKAIGVKTILVGSDYPKNESELISDLWFDDLFASCKFIVKTSVAGIQK